MYYMYTLSILHEVLNPWTAVRFQHTAISVVSVMKCHRYQGLSVDLCLSLGHMSLLL